MVLLTGLGLLVTLTLTTVVATLEGVVLRFAPNTAALLQILPNSLIARMLSILTTLVFFFLLYRLAPRRAITTRYAFEGALLAALLWELARAAFAYYVRNLAHYAGVYGALEGRCGSRCPCRSSCTAARLRPCASSGPAWRRPRPSSPRNRAGPRPRPNHRWDSRKLSVTRVRWRWAALPKPWPSPS